MAALGRAAPGVAVSRDVASQEFLRLCSPEGHALLPYDADLSGRLTAGRLLRVGPGRANERVGGDLQLIGSERCGASEHWLSRTAQ